MKLQWLLDGVGSDAPEITYALPDDLPQAWLPMFVPERFNAECGQIYTEPDLAGGFKFGLLTGLATCAASPHDRLAWTISATPGSRPR